MTDLLNEAVPQKTPTPDWVERLCADFGVMESGAPRYRVIWNPDRRRPMNILNPETGQSAQRNPLRYPQIGERWILEILLPWELYGTWHENAFGPKPADGEYVLSHVIQDNLAHMLNSPAGDPTGYMSLEDFGQDNLRLLLHCVEKSRAVQAWQLRNYDEEMIALEDKQFHDQFENVYDDNMAELEKVEKLSEKFGLPTSLDPIPKPIQEKRRKAAQKAGKQIIH